MSVFRPSRTEIEKPKNLAGHLFIIIILKVDQNNANEAGTQHGFDILELW